MAYYVIKEATSLRYFKLDDDKTMSLTGSMWEAERYNSILDAERVADIIIRNNYHSLALELDGGFVVMWVGDAFVPKRSLMIRDYPKVVQAIATNKRTRARYEALEEIKALRERLAYLIEKHGDLV